MFEHMTRDGHKMFIAAMDDEHLMNTIRLFAGPCIEATKNVDGLETIQSRRAEALYGKKILSPANYRRILHRTCVKLSPYIMEAVLRGLDVRQILVDVFGRNSLDREALDLGVIKTLDYDDDDDDDDDDLQ